MPCFGGETDTPRDSMTCSGLHPDLEQIWAQAFQDQGTIPAPYHLVSPVDGKHARSSIGDEGEAFIPEEGSQPWRS